MSWWEISCDGGSRKCMIMTGPSFSGTKKFVEHSAYEKVIKILKLMAVGDTNRNPESRFAVTMLKELGELT